MGVVRALLADDNQELLDALSDVLTQSRRFVVVAKVVAGADAVSCARSLRPDVAVVDVRMPGGGPDLVRRLVETVPHIHVIGLSSSQAVSVRAAMLAAGASGYLVKGDHGQDLPSAIYALVTAR